MANHEERREQDYYQNKQSERKVITTWNLSLAREKLCSDNKCFQFGTRLAAEGSTNFSFFGPFNERNQ